MWDKLSVINTALIRTGNNPVPFEADGTAEWIAGSDAYETELPILIADHDWGFARTTASLQRKGAATDPRFTDAFYKPTDCLHLEAVWLDGRGIVYSILDNLIQCSLGSSTVAPVGKFVAVPTPDQWPEHFIEVLRMRVMSHIYRGINEDPGNADRVYAASEVKLEQARARADQEQPGRAFFNTRLSRARRQMRGGLGPVRRSTLLEGR